MTPLWPIPQTTTLQPLRKWRGWEGMQLVLQEFRHPGLGYWKLLVCDRISKIKQNQIFPCAQNGLLFNKSRISPELPPRWL